MKLRSLASVVALSAALFPACNAGDCQGGGFVTPVPVVDQDDIPNIFPLCVGNNVTTIGDVNITSQAQLETLAGCTTVVGNVIILNSTDIVDLSVISTLENIEQGYFLAFNNAALTTIDMPTLVNIAYGIGVVDNPALTAVTFPAVVQAFGDITIRNNATLSNVAFPNLEQLLKDARNAPGNLIIAENPAFSGFQTFSKLEIIDGFFSVFSNDALQDFQGLELLNEIQNSGKAAQALAIGIDFDAENNIVDAGNAQLEDLSGLADLEVINGDIFIGFNPELTSLSGLDDLRVHQKNIFIAGNDSLVNLAGLEGDGGDDGEDDGLQVVNGSIFVGVFFDRFQQPVGAGNQALQNLTGLDNLGQLDGSLVLAFNPQLQDLSGLDVLPTIGGDLVIAGSQLDSFEGALALTTVNGNLFLGQLFGNDNKVLRQPLDVNEGLVDENKTDIAIDLDAPCVDVDTDFDALTTVNKDVVVAFANFGSLCISQNLTTIGGRFILHGSNVADFTGFENVANLGGLVVGLQVDKNGDFSNGGNNNLDAFTGLNVNALGAGGLAIGFNDNLDDLATLPNFNDIAGDVTVVAQDFSSLEGLDVSAIGGDLNVGVIRNANNEPLDFGLDQLTSVALQELATVNGSVLIAFNDDLADVGFTLLNNVGGAFEITANNALADIAGLNALATVGDLRVHDLPELTTMNLQGLAVVDNDLFLVRNPQLETVNLNSLNLVGGTAELSQLDNIIDLNFLTNLNTVGDLANQVGDFLIFDNADLADISGLNGLQSVGGTLLLARNPSVDNLELGSLQQVGGSFDINAMDGLVDLQPLATGTQALNAVGDALRIQNNANLESLNGLEAVAVIGRTLSIVNNPKLETILIDDGTQDVEDQADDQGLLILTTVGNPDPAVEGVGGEDGVVEVQNNPLLDEDQVQDLLNDLDGFIGQQLLCGNTGSAAACLALEDVQGQGVDDGGEGEGE